MKTMTLVFAFCAVFIAESRGECELSVDQATPDSPSYVGIEKVSDSLVNMDRSNPNYSRIMDIAGAEVVAIIKGQGNSETRDVLRLVRKEII